MNDELGKRIKLALEQAGRRQSDLAKAVSRGQPTVSLWIKGKRAPSLREVAAMAKYLGVSPSWLAFGVDTVGRDTIDPDRLQRAADMVSRSGTPKEKYGERIRWLYKQLDDDEAAELLEDLLKPVK